MSRSQLFYGVMAILGCLLLAGLFIPTVSTGCGGIAGMRASKSQFANYVTALQMFKGEYGVIRIALRLPPFSEQLNYFLVSAPFEANQNLLFIGDSITDCGRERPFGRRKGNLGVGYVSFIDSILGAALPEVPVRVLNTGISGNRVTDLEARWQSDVLDLEPDWLSVMIGINDVWRQFDGEPRMAQVEPGQFESVYRDLLAKTKPQLKGLVLMTPFFLETNRSDPMRAKMDLYGEITQKLAGEFDAIFVDVQAAFDRYLEHQPTQSLCGDRVHPNGVGHMIIARAFLSAVGVS